MAKKQSKDKPTQKIADANATEILNNLRNQFEALQVLLDSFESEKKDISDRIDSLQEAMAELGNAIDELENV